MHIFAENEPVLFLIHEIVVNENDDLVLIAQRILNCIFDSHSYAYKVSDFKNYD